MVPLGGAVGPFVLGLRQKRKKVPHPGLQHVGVHRTLLANILRSLFNSYILNNMMHYKLQIAVFGL